MPTPPASNGRQRKRTSTAVAAPGRADTHDHDEQQALQAAVRKSDI